MANTSILYFTLSQGSLEDESVTFTTGATPSDLGEGLQIQFDVQNGDHDSSNGGVVLDNVRLTESGPNIVAPEPSTWAMLLLGAGGLLFLARRKLNA